MLDGQCFLVQIQIECTDSFLIIFPKMKRMSRNIVCSHFASTDSSSFDLFADTASQCQLVGILRVLFIRDTQ